MDVIKPWMLATFCLWSTKLTFFIINFHSAGILGTGDIKKVNRKLVSAEFCLWPPETLGFYCKTYKRAVLADVGVFEPLVSLGRSSQQYPCQSSLCEQLKSTTNHWQDMFIEKWLIYIHCYCENCYYESTGNRQLRQQIDF